MRFLFTFFLAIVTTINSNAQCNSELKQYTHGFDTIEASSFSFLDQQLNDIRIFGYGEDTHGTAEFTILAEELMKYLNEKHSFKILILETGFGEGQYFNDYIQGRANDLKMIMDKHNSTWRYDTKEFYHLLNTLRTYNMNHSEKIHLYGCEMQYVIADVNRIQDYLKTVNSSYKIEGFEKHLWQDIDENEKTDYYISYAQLKKYFVENSETFRSKTSEKAFNAAYHHIEVLGQFVTAINQNVEQRKHDFRDIYMGENIQWILNFHGTHSKAMYWAHNAHVGDWVSNGIVDVTGHQLKKLYGDSYFSVVTDFGTGEFMAFSRDWKMETFGYSEIDENSFTKCLQNFGSPNTFLNLRAAKKDTNLAQFLSQPLKTMSGAGAQVKINRTETNDLGKAFDAIIYLDNTNKINRSN